MDARIPAHLEAGALIRLTQAHGGFAAVLHKGHETAGTLLLILTENGTNTRAYERMPQLDGSRAWACIRSQNTENPHEFGDYIDRRSKQDDDLWVIELDIPGGERLIGLTGGSD